MNMTKTVWVLEETLPEHHETDYQTTLIGIYGSISAGATAFLEQLDYHLKVGYDGMTQDILEHKGEDHEWFLGYGHDVVDGVLQVKLGALKKAMNEDRCASIGWDDFNQCVSIREVEVQ
jgi:hypothetical protein